MASDRLEKSCGCIIVRNGKNNREVLIIQNAKGRHWSFPKGHMEGEEAELATARREVMEETGLRVDIQKDFRATSHYLTRKRIPKEVVYYLATTPDDTLHLQVEEVSDAAWLPVSTALQRLTFERDVRVLKDAVRYLGDER